jgi:hypothetical protein
MPRTKSVFFGTSPDQSYDNGDFPCCAINAGNFCVAIHEGTGSDSLNYRLGAVGGLKLSFIPAPKQNKFGNGADPSVVLTNDGVVVEAHGTKRSGGNLMFQIGVIKNSTIGFLGSPARIGKGKGDNPSIATDQAGHIVEVHQRDSKLYYRLGGFDSAKRQVTWPDDDIDLTKPGDRPTVGESPFVTMNRSGQLVAVYVNQGRLFYLRGSLINNGTGIQWNRVGPYVSGTDTRGQNPSVALTDDGYLYEVHELEKRLYQRVGRLNADGASIDWQEWLDRRPGNPLLDNAFDNGTRVQIATNGKVAIQVHETESPVSKGLFANAALSFDHANWMGDNRDRILSRTLQNLALPASHDSGAYMDGSLADIAAQTQRFSIYGQLASGVRYFDLRPTYRGNANQPFQADQLFTHHDIIKGPAFTTVLKDVSDFMREHNELVILKISHYDNFNQTVFSGMVALIQQELRTWLFDDTNRGATRLANRPMSDYLSPDKGTVVVVTDSDGDHNPNNIPPDREYLPDPRPTGLFRYRDWYATDPQRGDLTVFDVFSNTNSFDAMIEGKGNDPDSQRGVLRNGTPLQQGQFPKYRWFDGICRNQYLDGGVKKDWPCDLFLLSWTLTPTLVDIAAGNTAIILARTANQKLVDYVSDLGASPRGQRVNLIYTDNVQNSRSADVALLQNKIAP